MGLLKSRPLGHAAAASSHSLLLRSLTQKLLPRGDLPVKLPLGPCLSTYLFGCSHQDVREICPALALPGSLNFCHFT